MCNSQNLCKTAVVILIWNGFSALATVYDSDGSSINIQSIHDALAQNGDTITLPTGTFTWTTTVTITKGITLIGADNDQTIIQDNVPRPKNDTGLLVVSGSLGKTYRVSGLSFVSGINVLNSWGMVRIIATGAASQAVRVDHCHFENNPNQEVYLS